MKPQQEQIVEAGEFNRRIVFLRPSTTQDSTGQPLQGSPTTVYACWASINPIGGEQIFQGVEFVSEVSDVITIRYTSSVVVNVGDQIQYTETPAGVVHTYQVKAIINRMQRNRTIMFLCYELGARE